MANLLMPKLTGASLRRRRRKAGLTQQALAEQAGCSITTVRYAEYGVSPSLTMAERISTALVKAEASAESR